MENEKGCCIAASCEAKIHGLKTGTGMPEARRLCPGIVFQPGRHRLYVRYTLRVADVLDRFADLERFRSVDEFQMSLSGEASDLPGSLQLLCASSARSFSPAAFA